MISLLRQYLQTITLFAAGMFLGWPLWLTITSVLLAAIIDLGLTSRSSELTLYQQDSDLNGATSLPDGRLQAARWQIVGVVVSGGIPLAASGVGASTTWQGLANMGALLVASTIGSVCGSRAIRNPSLSRRELVARTESLPDVFFIVDLLPRHVARLVGSVARFTLGVICILPFVAALRSIHLEPPGVTLVLFMLGLAAFYQLGFIVLSQAMFLFRWRRGEVQQAG